MVRTAEEQAAVLAWIESELELRRVAAARLRGGGPRDPVVRDALIESYHRRRLD